MDKLNLNLNLKKLIFLLKQGEKEINQQRINTDLINEIIYNIELLSVILKKYHLTKQIYFILNNHI